MKKFKALRADTALFSLFWKSTLRADALNLTKLKTPAFMFASRENLHPATSHQTLLDLLRFQKFSICNHTCGMLKTSIVFPILFIFPFSLFFLEDGENMDR